MVGGVTGRHVFLDWDIQSQTETGIPVTGVGVMFHLVGVAPHCAQCGQPDLGLWATSDIPHAFSLLHLAYQRRLR